MKTPEEYYAQARTLFFAAHADFQAALDELTESDARAANLSLRQLREWHAERIYAAFLRQKRTLSEAVLKKHHRYTSNRTNSQGKSCTTRPKLYNLVGTASVVDCP